jgi:hypothetical protein
MDFSKQIDLVKEWAAAEGLVAQPFEDEIGGGVNLATPKVSESAVTVSFGGLSVFESRPHSLEEIVKSRFTNAVRTLREAAL